jgi:hypothetical protein
MSERSRYPRPTAHAEHKAAVLARLRELKARGLSLQAMADRLNAEGVPTLSGRGKWQKDTIGNLLSQVEEHYDDHRKDGERFSIGSYGSFSACCALSNSSF